MPAQDKSQVSLRLPTSLVTQFDRIAGILDRDRTWVMQRALVEYLDREGAELLEEAEGLAQLDAGESSDLDEVLNKATSIIDAAEKRFHKAV